MRDLVKVFTEMFWGESSADIGFIKFVVTFVSIFMAIKFYIYITTGKD
jgi:hypothetical protein